MWSMQNLFLFSGLHLIQRGRRLSEPEVCTPSWYFRSHHILKVSEMIQIWCESQNRPPPRGLRCVWALFTCSTPQGADFSPRKHQYLHSNMAALCTPCARRVHSGVSFASGRTAATRGSRRCDWCPGPTERVVVFCLVWLNLSTYLRPPESTPPRLYHRMSDAWSSEVEVTRETC